MHWQWSDWIVGEIPTEVDWWIYMCFQYSKWRHMLVFLGGYIGLQNSPVLSFSLNSSWPLKHGIQDTEVFHSKVFHHKLGYKWTISQNIHSKTIIQWIVLQVSFLYLLNVLLNIDCWTSSYHQIFFSSPLFFSSSVKWIWGLSLRTKGRASGFVQKTLKPIFWQDYWLPSLSRHILINLKRCLNIQEFFSQSRESHDLSPFLPLFHFLGIYEAYLGWSSRVKRIHFSLRRHTFP